MQLNSTPVIKAGVACQKFGLELRGDPEISIVGVGDPLTANEGQLCFVQSEDYIPDMMTSSSRCFVVSPKIFEKIDEGRKAEKTFLLSANPYLSFVEVIKYFHPEPERTPGIHPSAVVEKGATVHPSAQIMALAYVGKNSKIGANVVVYPQVWIGENAQIGEGSILYSGSKIYHSCILGRYNIIHAGAVIGSDGFGFLPIQGRSEKIPQVGRAVLGDHVEVGANTTIDRGTIDDTTIGSGTKIDNLVQVGHNCKVGKNVILCAFVGLSGNTTVGDNCLFAGQAATKGHLTVGKNVRVAGRTGISKDIGDNQDVKGYPAQPVKDYLKLRVLYMKLPEIYKRLVKLEGKINGSS